MNFKQANTSRDWKYLASIASVSADAPKSCLEIIKLSRVVCLPLMAVIMTLKSHFNCF